MGDEPFLCHCADCHGSILQHPDTAGGHEFTPLIGEQFCVPVPINTHQGIGCPQVDSDDCHWITPSFPLSGRASGNALHTSSIIQQNVSRKYKNCIFWKFLFRHKSGIFRANHPKPHCAGCGLSYIMGLTGKVPELCEREFWRKAMARSASGPGPCRMEEPL